MNDAQSCRAQGTGLKAQGGYLAQILTKISAFGQLDIYRPAK